MSYLKEYVAQGIKVQKYRLKNEENIVNWMTTDSAKQLAKEIYNIDPQEWWHSIDE